MIISLAEERCAAAEDISFARKPGGNIYQDKSDHGQHPVRELFFQELRHYLGTSTIDLSVLTCTSQVHTIP